MRKIFFARSIFTWIDDFIKKHPDVTVYAKKKLNCDTEWDEYSDFVQILKSHIESVKRRINLAKIKASNAKKEADIKKKEASIKKMNDEMMNDLKNRDKRKKVK